MFPDRVQFDESPNEAGAGIQRLAARFAGHAYDLHRHETYSIGLTVQGTQCFRYRGIDRASQAGQVLVLHPDEAHDGHAGTESGFTYRMIYVDPALIGATPFVPDVVAHDPVLRDIVEEAFTDFPSPLEPLAQDSLLARLADGLANRSDGRPSPRRKPLAGRGVALARDFLIAEAHRAIGSEELERVSGLDHFTLARQFRSAFGTSPHRFQIGRRLARARSLIGRGMALVDAAASAGFADQSHLTRHFATRFGLTPGRWATLNRADSDPHRRAS